VNRAEGQEEETSTSGRAKFLVNQLARLFDQMPASKRARFCGG
jgi:hypothetical protein